MSQLQPLTEASPSYPTRSRRPFELSSSSLSSGQNTSPSTPTDSSKPELETLKRSTLEDGSNVQSRTRSFLNLTSSTLFGIYQPTGYDTNPEDSTPWGTGAQTPIDQSRPVSFDFSNSLRPDSYKIIAERRESAEQHKASFSSNRRRKSSAARLKQYKVRRGLRGYILPLLTRVVSLFGLGILYGLLIAHLHDTRNLAPIKLDIDRSWGYLIIWGTAGVLLGEALPYIDRVWAQLQDEEAVEGVIDDQTTTGSPAAQDDDDETEPENNTRGVGAWNDVIRSIGLFVGIAFAIRRLPWESTLQLSLTLALSNPAIWYIIDRSPPGFALSAFVALSGTALVLAVQPTWLPPPSLFPTGISGSGAHKTSVNGTKVPIGPEDLVLGIFTHDTVGAVTWIASVLFVSAVCFGNLGRRLADYTT